MREAARLVPLAGKRKRLALTDGEKGAGTDGALRIVGEAGKARVRRWATGVPQVAERIPLIRRRLPGLGWPFSYYRAAVAISTTSVTLGILTPSLA